MRFRVDSDRIKEVGPDVACAEWLMRNGALVKWVGHSRYLKDYNLLVSPNQTRNQRFIEEVDATESSIMSMGFSHFNGCNHIRSIKFHRCPNIEDKALKNLLILKDSLEELQVVSCGNVTDKGVKTLVNLKNLKNLVLRDLPAVENTDECAQHIKQALPKCEIDI